MGKFNDFNTNPKHKINRLVLLFGGVLVTFILLLIFAVKIILPLFEEFTTANILAFFALFLTVFSLVFTIGKYLYENQLSVKSNIQLSVIVKDKTAIIQCTVENNGRKRFIPQNVYAFVEQGLKNEDNKAVEFPFLLKHEQGECDCNLSKKCKQGGVVIYPPEMIEEKRKGLYHKVFKFQHLSHEAIMYIDPGEEFKDSIVLDLDKGIYRVMAIATIVKRDCLCSTESFVIL